MVERVKGNEGTVNLEEEIQDRFDKIQVLLSEQSSSWEAIYENTDRIIKQVDQQLGKGMRGYNADEVITTLRFGWVERLLILNAVARLGSELDGIRNQIENIKKSL